MKPESRPPTSSPTPSSTPSNIPSDPTSSTPSSTPSQVSVRWAYDTSELGRVVQRVRLDNNLTQKELADRLGVARMTVSRLEKGEAVSIETAMRALSECGYAIAVAPKFSRLVLDPSRSPAVSLVAANEPTVG